MPNNKRRARKISKQKIEFIKYKTQWVRNSTVYIQSNFVI